MISPALLDEFAKLVESHFGTRNFLQAIIRVRREKYATSYPDKLSDMLEKVFWATNEDSCDSISAEDEIYLDSYPSV